MKDVDRFKLLGRYRTPRVRAGNVLSCEFRDCDVIVTGYTAARIPWPVGRRRGSGSRTLVVFGALAEAIRCESNLAVSYWFGVLPGLVSAWRKALGVEPMTDGTGRLRREHGKSDWWKIAGVKGRAKARDPERRRKISEARRGKKRPPHVIEAMRKGRTGKPQSEEARAKMRAAWKARRPGFAPNGRAWTKGEDELVRMLPAPEVARQTKRSLAAVYSRRVRLVLPDGRVR
jgi:NUMOD3 motif